MKTGGEELEGAGGGTGDDAPDRLRRPSIRVAEIDSHVGRRIRERREALGMSQGRLGRHLGLTFSQVQKYEKGMNRVGAGRLYALSVLLDVPVQYFFEGVPEAGRPASPESRPTIDTVEAARLQEAFRRISDPEARHALLTFVSSLVET